MTTTDIFNAGSASPDEVLNEKARRAVQAFRAMQGGLTGYAQALTNNRQVQVVLAEGAPRTDGKKIYFKPPIELGDLRSHVRALCDKRDSETMLQLCEACRIREQVLISIYHEVAHIVYGTFSKVSDRSKLEAVERAVAEAPGKYAQKVRESWAAVPDYRKGSYLSLSGLISPFLPILVNALEDARVDEAMFKARRGTKVMFDAYCRSIFVNGNKQDDGSVMRWSDKPLNSQILIGVFVVACKYDYEGWFDPKVEEALADPDLRALIERVEMLRSAEGTYNLAFPILARLRELGFCRNPEEEEDEPEAGEDPGDDQGEGEPEDADSDSDDAVGEEPDESPEEPESGDGDSSDDASDDGQPEADEASGDGVSDPEGGADEGQDASSGDSEGDESSGGDPGDAEESGGDGDPASESAQDDHGDELPDQGSEQDQSDGSTGGADGESSEPGSPGLPEEGSSDGAAPGLPDGDEPDDAPDEAGEADDREQTEEQAELGDDGADEPAPESVEGEAVDEADSDADGDAESEGDRGGSDPQEAGDDADDLSDGTRDRDGESDDGEGDEVPADEGNPGDDEGDEESADPVDTGEYTDTGAVEDKSPNYGDAADALEDFKVFSAHEDPPDAIDSSGADQAEEKAMDRAIIQSMYFEKPSANVTGVREHKYGQDSYTDGRKVRSAWDAATMYGHSASYKRDLEEIGVGIDLTIGEDVLGPALGEMRRAFADNQRADMQRHLKAGRVNNKVLGKRAWGGDPRLFQKKRVPGKRSYAVILGIDISGSTMGLNIHLAKRAAMAQAELCHRLGVDFAIYAHTAQSKSGGWGDNDLYLDMFEIKGFDQAWNPDAKKALQDVSSLAENLDGHGVEYYRRMIERHSATDKIILYYSDGKMPAANHDEELEILQREIKYCRSRHITLLGVGIRTNSPQRHGLDTVRVDKDSDISKVVKHLEVALLSNR